MSPAVFVGIIMSGVEALLQHVADSFEVLRSDAEEAQTEAQGIESCEDTARSLLTRFSEECLWQPLGEAEGEEGRGYLGGFLGHAVRLLVAGSAYPRSSGLLRLLVPPLKDILSPLDEEDLGEAESCVTLLLRGAVATTFVGTLLSSWQRGADCGGASPEGGVGTDSTSLMAALNELIQIAVESVYGLLSDRDSRLVSGIALRMGLQQLSEGDELNVLEPVLAVLCAEWRLPDGRDVWFLGSVLAEVERGVIRGDAAASTQCLSSVYDILKYLDALEMLDYVKRQEVIAFARRANRDRDSDSEVSQLLIGIEHYFSGR